jgi:hypothetical protein
VWVIGLGCVRLWGGHKFRATFCDALTFLTVVTTEMLMIFDLLFGSMSIFSPFASFFGPIAYSIEYWEKEGETQRHSTARRDAIILFFIFFNKMDRRIGPDWARL